MAATHWNRLLQQIRRLSDSPREQDSDAQLLERFRANRDEAAFTALLRRHGAMVFGVCRRVLHHEQDAEDAFQATFLVLARKAASLRPQRSLDGWLHQVAYHLALRARRTAAQRQRIENEVRSMMSREEPEMEAYRRELRSLLDEELQRLPPKYREPLILCYLEGKTNEQAARQLGWPIGSMSRRLARGRELLRRRLLHRGVTLPVGALAAVLIEEAATAALPPLLAASAARMALQSSGLGIPASVVALVEGGLREMVMLKARITLLLMLSAVGLVVGALAYQTKGKEATEVRAAPQAKAAPEANTTPEQPRIDRNGDLLPPGALARLGSIRLRHLSAAVAFSPDGKTLLSAGRDAMLRYWEPASGKEIRRLRVQSADSYIYSPMFAADGKIVIGHASGVIHAWDTTTGKELQRFPVGNVQRAGLEHIPIMIHSLSLSPNGKRLAAYLYDIFEHTVPVWDVSTGKKLFTLKMKRNQVNNSMAFSPDGKLLATAAWDGVLHLRDTATAKEVLKISGPLRVSEFSPDGKHIGAKVGDDIKIWNVADGKEVFDVKPAAGDQLYSLTFVPDNKTLAVSTSEGLALYDMAAGKRLRTIPKCGGRLAFSPDGKTAATSGTAIRLWDLTAGKEIGTSSGCAGAVTSLAVAPDGRTVAALAEPDFPVVRLWDAASGKQILQIDTLKDHVRSGAFTPDGRFLVTGSDKSLRLWDCKTGTEVRKFTIQSHDAAQQNWGFWAATLSSDGERLAAVVVGSVSATNAIPTSEVHIWNTATGKVLTRATLKRHSHWMRFSPDVRSMAIEKREGIAVADTVTGQELVKLTGRAPLAYSPDSQILALAQLKKKPLPPGIGEGCPGAVDAVCLVELATGKELLQIKTGPVDYRLLAYSADGRTLATADSDNFHIWDAATGRELLRRALPESGLRPDSPLESSFASSLAFFPGGERLATGLMDGTALIWDLNSTTRQAGFAVNDLASSDLKRLWTELAGEDAAKAYRAEWTLAAVPAKAIPFLRNHLHPVCALHAKQVQPLINDLDSPEFAVRDAAGKKLASFGERAEAALRRALEGKPSLEARKRLEALHMDAELAGHNIVHSTELLRTIRAIRVLEHIGDGEARQVLQKLAGGDAAARATRQAKEALKLLR